MKTSTLTSEDKSIVRDDTDVGHDTNREVVADEDGDATNETASATDTPNRE
eukprot:CAMPEP_0198128698 /NCGR_PEP_ID=MMETSP1442-20131203/49943_1 /TAXON_ID= /ORGANISM="Craspedostauros australis, Strain CCMP3328" /LENGTH=50 /DNA_ID=CAMNT_0043788905 /DNA_START=68 /DNA_END=220 /DNA_ORIENTATION=+